MSPISTISTAKYLKGVKVAVTTSSSGTRTTGGVGLKSGYSDVVPGVCGAKSYPAKDAGKESEYKKVNTKGDVALASKILNKVFTQLDPETAKGLCAKYVKNLAEVYWKVYSDSSLSISTIPSHKVKSGTYSSPESGGRQDAKSKKTHNNLISLFGYTRYRLASNVTRSEATSIIDTITYYPGDIMIYWEHSGTSESKQKYGHIAMYLEGSRWISDFKHSRFAYSGGTCWEVIYLKSPDKPILIKNA